MRANKLKQATSRLAEHGDSILNLLTLFSNKGPIRQAVLLWLFVSSYIYCSVELEAADAEQLGLGT